MLGLIAKPYDMTITADGQASAAAFPKSNVANNDYGRVGRTTSGAVTSYSWYVDLGASKAVDCVALLWHNLRAGVDTIIIRAGDTVADATTGVLYNSGTLPVVTGVSLRDPPPPFGKFLLTLANAITARYWCFRMSVNTSVHPDGYVQASRFFVGKKAVFAIGPQAAQLSAVDYNTRVTTEVGEDRATEDPNLIRPVAQLDLKYAKESEVDDVLAGYTLGLGTSRAMLMTPDATGANLQDTLVFGRPERVINVSSETYDVWEFQATVQSIGP